jgi:hypothetical protein
LTFSGGVLTLVFWHTIEHLTEGGDVAPGFGPFRSEVIDESDETT